jgi:hypothetical protein
VLSGHTHENTITPLPSVDQSSPDLGFREVKTASLRDFPQELRTNDIIRNSDNTILVFTTDIDPAVRDGSPAGISRFRAIASHKIFNNSVTELPTGAYNAGLVKQLTPAMQVKIQELGNPVSP